MAEQTDNVKTLSFAGRTLDQNEFVRRAQAKAIAWMDYQGLQGDERTDFMNSFNQRLAGLTNGSYSSSASGEIEGAPSSQEQYYNKRTGKRTDNNGKLGARRRIGFDPNGNVDIYLNGIAGAMSEYSPSESTAPASSGKKVWDSKTSMGTYVGNAIFGEGNPFNTEQLTRWADAYDKVGDNGSRSTVNRQSFIVNELNKYKEALLNGDYDISDVDKQAELNKIEQLIGDNQLSDFELGKLAPWMSNLLFTDDKYYASSAERDAAITAANEKKEQDERLQAAIDYENLIDGSNNPYEQGSEEYNSLEVKRALKLKDQDINDFLKHQWGYSDSGKTFQTYVTTGLPEDLFEGWNVNNLRDYLNGAEGLVTNELGQDIKKAGWEMFHDKYTGWGEGDVSLEGSGLKEYFDALPNDFVPDDTRKNDGFKARSNRSLLGKAAVDYARAKVAKTGSTYMTNDGGYILPEFIDWNTGKAYKFTFNGSNGKVNTVNIGDIINGANKDSELFKNLMNEWQLYNKKPTYYKEGGILKAATGAPLSAKEREFLSTTNNNTFVNPVYTTNVTPSGNVFNSAVNNDEKLQQEYENAQAIGAEKTYRKDLENSTEFKPTDYARLGTVAADLTGAILSLTGVGSTAGAIVGGASSLTQFGLDIADRSVGFGQALGALGAGLAMDAFTLIPEVGAAAGFAKAAKTITKLAGPIMASFQLMANSEGAISTLKKITSGDAKNITVGEWREFTRALNAVTNGTTMGKTAYDRRLGKFKGLNTTDKSFKFKAGDKEFSLTGSQIKEVNSTGLANGNTAAMAKINEFAKANGALKEGEQLSGLESLIDFSKADKAFGSLRSTKMKGKGPSETVIPEGVKSRLKTMDEQNAIDKAKLTGFRKYIADKFGTDYENATGGRKAFAGRQALYANETAKALANIQNVDDAARVAALESLRNRQYQYTTDLQAKKAPMDALASEIATRGKTIKETQQALPKAQQELVAAQDALSKAPARPAQAQFDKLKADRKANQDLIESLKDAVAAGGEKAPVKSARIKEINKERAGLLKDKLQFEQDLAQRKASNPTPVGAEKAKQTKLAKQIADIEKQLKTIASEKAELSKQFKESSKAWKLAEQARQQSETAAKNLETIQKDFDNLVSTDRQYTDAEKAVATASKSVTEKQKTLADESAARKAAITKVRKMHKDMQDFKRKVTDPKDAQYQQLLEQTLGETITGETPAIKDAKVANFQSMVADLTNKSNLSERQVLELLKDKKVLAQLRAAYRFANGGIIKGAKGTPIIKTTSTADPITTSVADPIVPPIKPTNQPTNVTTPYVASVSGVLGGDNSKVAGTLGVNPNDNTGTLGEDNTAKTPGVSGVDYTTLFNKYGGNTNVNHALNPYDAKITGLELLKSVYGNVINGNILRNYLDTPIHLVNPFMKHYRQWTSKPLLDRANEVVTSFRNLGAMSAAGTTDQGAAFAYNLNALKQGVEQSNPLILQANKDFRDSVDKQNDTGNENNYNKYEVGEKNSLAIDAKKASDLYYKNAFLTQKGNDTRNLMLSMQAGLAKSGIANDKRAYEQALNTDPAVLEATSRYKNLLLKKVHDPNNWNEEVDGQALREAKLDLQLAQQNVSSNFSSSRVMTTGAPFTGWGPTWTTQSKTVPQFDFGYSTNPFFKRQGGKMLAAEKEKTRREYEKIFHDSVKMSISEKNKNWRSSQALAYYRKLFMSR